MPSKKKKYNARFPPARIKKIMQTDEEVGKVAAAVPVIISRALELFIQSLIVKSSDTTKSRHSKTLSTAHIKHTIQSEKRFDFLTDLVSNIADVQGDDDGAEDRPTTSSEGEPKSRGRPKKKNATEEETGKKQCNKRQKLQMEDPDTEETDSASEDPGSEGDEEDEEEDEKEDEDADLHSPGFSTSKTEPGFSAVKTEPSCEPQKSEQPPIPPLIKQEDNEMESSSGSSDEQGLDLKMKWSVLSSSALAEQSHDGVSSVSSGHLQGGQLDNDRMPPSHHEQTEDANKSETFIQSSVVDPDHKRQELDSCLKSITRKNNDNTLEVGSSWKGRNNPKKSRLNKPVLDNQKAINCQNKNSTLDMKAKNVQHMDCEPGPAQQHGNSMEEHLAKAHRDMIAGSELHPHSVFANMQNVVPLPYPHPGLIPPVGPPFPRPLDAANYIMSSFPPGMMPPMALHPSMLNTPVSLMQPYPPLQRMLDPRHHLPDLNSVPHMAAGGLSGHPAGPPPPAHTTPIHMTPAHMTPAHRTPVQHNASSTVDQPHHPKS